MVKALTVFNGNLIASGVFNSAGGNPANNIASWDGSSWHALGSGLETHAGFVSVNALAVYNGELYAAGSFHTAGGVPAENIARWDGTAWHAVGKGIPGSAGVNTLASYKGMLYVGGYFNDTVQGVLTKNIERWDGTAWSLIPNIYSDTFGVDGYIESLCATDNFLYIGGAFQSKLILPGIGYLSVNSIGRWDTSTAYYGYSPLVDTTGGTGIRYGGASWSSAVHAMTLHNGKLYLSGLFDTAGTKRVSDIASYDDYVFGYVPNPCGPNYELFSPMISYGGKLVSQSLVGSGKGLTQFDGSQWTGLGGGFSGSTPAILALCEYGGDLYAGGQFTQASGSNVMNIAKWASPNGIADLKPHAITIFPNPTNDAITILNMEAHAPVRVSDIFGNVVFTGTSDENGIVHLSLSSLSQGMYFANGMKFIKE